MNDKPRWRSANELMQALSAGILAADPYWKGYSPPPGLADVLTDFARAVHETGDAIGAFQATYDEVRANLTGFVHAHPICLAWNRWEGDDVQYKFTSRYSPLPTKREFIDLDAIVQNAMVWIRGRDDTFDAVDSAVAGRKP